MRRPSVVIPVPGQAWSLLVAILCVLGPAGCGSTRYPPAEKDNASSTDAFPSTTSQTSVPAATSLPGDKPTLIEGSCEGGRELGDLSHYALRLRAKPNTLGFIRVRSWASWDAGDLSNVLGTVPCGAILWGEGPLKNAEYSCGIGYAVAVRDSQGRRCRGYVSYTVVEVLDP